MHTNLILSKMLELRQVNRVQVLLLIYKQMEPLLSSPAEHNTSTWDKSWAESSLSENPTADRHFYDGSEEIDDVSSVLTTSTMPWSEYQRRVLAADVQRYQLQFEMNRSLVILLF